MEPGAAFPWHFDENDVTLTLMLQPAEHGGTFEFFPIFALFKMKRHRCRCNPQWQSDGRDTVDPRRRRLADLLRAELPASCDLGSAGSRPRYLFAPAWNDVPNLVNTVQRSIGSYGRALDVHRQRESLNGRDGLRG